jgi:predicted RNase H-like HicB family nuclease
MNRYTYRAEWSSEFREYISRCLELPWLSQRAPTLTEAIAGIERAVDEYLAERDGDGPRPLTDRNSAAGFWCGHRRCCTPGSPSKPPSKMCR